MWAEQRAIAGSDDDPLVPPNGFATAQDYAAYLDAAVREELAQTGSALKARTANRKRELLG